MKKFLFLALILIPFLLVSCPDQNGREIDVAPRIVLIGPSEVFFNVNDTYVEYGYLATDVDGNVQNATVAWRNSSGAVTTLNSIKEIGVYTAEASIQDGNYVIKGQYKQTITIQATYLDEKGE